jgi:hypothetical protein
VLLGACGPGNSLGGSASESYDLTFDDVRIRKQGDHVIVEYLQSLEVGANKACKVVADLKGLRVKGGLSMRREEFLGRVTVSRVAATGGDFPESKSGSIRFGALRFRDGGSVDGRFDAVFVTGRTLHGEFAGHFDEVPLE